MESKEVRFPLSEQAMQRAHHVGNWRVRLMQQLVNLALGLLVPMPRVFKRLALHLVKAVAHARLSFDDQMITSAAYQALWRRL